MYGDTNNGFGVWGLIAVLVVLFMFGNNRFNHDGCCSNNTIELMRGQETLMGQINNSNILGLQSANATQAMIAQSTNATQLAQANLSALSQQCCCDTQKLILQQAADARLESCQQTSRLANGIADLGYATQRQTDAILLANTVNTQKILDAMNTHWYNDIAQKYNDARVELSQQSQTNNLTIQLNAIANAISKIPTT